MYADKYKYKIVIVKFFIEFLFLFYIAPKCWVDEKNYYGRSVRGFKKGFFW